MSFLNYKFDICFLDLPKDFKVTEKEVYDKLKSNKFKDLNSSQEFGDGWVNVSDMFKDFEMEDILVVDSYVGGYRFDKKKVPPALLKKLYNEKLKERNKEGVKLTKEDKKMIKQECKDQLMMQTLATPKMISWILDTEKNMVYLNTKSSSVVDTFIKLFNTTFDTSITVNNFDFQNESEISEFLDYVWKNLETSENTESPNFWIDQEVTFDFDKNVFKFNGPRIEEYRADIENFKKSKRIKSINFGAKIGDSDYSLTLNNQNMAISVECLEKITHESVETAVLDNTDRIHKIMDLIKDLAKKFKTE
jgi:hypothetical protein